jgi:hypothetical protein
MSESKDSKIVLDGPYEHADFADPKWVDYTKKEIGLDAEGSEFSARARKKKRIYKRKKTEKKPDA